MVRHGRTLIGMVLCLGASSVFASERLAITGAIWKPDRSELRIEGYSERVDDVVLLRDAETKKLLGSAAVRGDGKWMLKVLHPTSVPTRLAVTCGKETKECAVEKTVP